MPMKATKSSIEEMIDNFPNDTECSTDEQKDLDNLLEEILEEL